MTTYKVGYFVGSLSSKSINRILSKALIKLAPHDLEFSEIPIGNLPLYSPDYDTNYPPEATALKEAIAQSDALLFITPDYNRSIPGPTLEVGQGSEARFEPFARAVAALDLERLFVAGSALHVVVGSDGT